jgi:ABC-type bacteriocin/lantibiotic exporter with double-glycine peptidase domain
MRHLVKKLLFLLTSTEKRAIILLCGMMIINGIIEVLAVASIAPLMTLLVSPASAESSAMLGGLLKFLEFFSTENTTVVIGVFVCGVILLANSSALLTNFLLIRFANNREYSISSKLLEIYLRQPYAFFLKRHSMELLKNTFNEVALVVTNVLVQLLNLASRLISVCAIVGFIVFVNPALTLTVAASLLVLYTGMYVCIRKGLYRLGQRRVALTEDKFRITADSVRIIKGIKMLNAENIFLEKYNNVSEQYARVRSVSETAAIAPRYVVEVIAMVGMVIAVAFLTAQDENNSELVPMMAIYAFAGYRMLPHMQQIFNALSNIRLSTHSLNVIHHEFTEYTGTQETIKESTVIRKMATALDVSNVSFAYAEGALILDGVSIRLPLGGKVGIIGASGSGKSTLIDLICGLNYPKQGAIVVDGIPLTQQDSIAWRRNIAYVSQSAYLLDDTLAANVALADRGRSVNQERLQTALKLAQVDSFASQLDKGIETIIGEDGTRLSGGQRQRIGIARALYQNTDILIMDEATSALDSQTERRILDGIRSLDKTMLFISHRVETLDFCDTLYVMDKGRIIASGTPKQLLANTELASYFYKAAHESLPQEDTNAPILVR